MLFNKVILASGDTIFTKAMFTNINVKPNGKIIFRKLAHGSN